MPSAYPGALDTLATDKANATATTADHPGHHNDLADAVNKIEAELGIDPAGAEATVVARLDAMDSAIGGISGGDVVFADTPDTSTSISSATDVQAFTTNVAGLAAGDILEVEMWGFNQNSTGSGQTYVYTLDFDGAFDMEWSWQADFIIQGFKLVALVSVIAANDATLNLRTMVSAQGAAGSLTDMPSNKYGYDVTTQDLTGTTAVTLNGRCSSSTTAGSTLNLLGVVIRKISST